MSHGLTSRRRFLGAVATATAAMAAGGCHRAASLEKNK